jgi:hypothetical protein
MASMRATTVPASPAGRRSRLATAVLALTALSTLAFLVLVLGSLLDWSGFTSDAGDESTFADVTWSTFALAGLLGLVLGLVAWLRGHRREDLGDIHAGQVAIGWLVCAIAISAIWSVFD